MATNINKLFDFILPKKKSSAGGTSYTDTFDPTRTSDTLDMPDYVEHLNDISETRLTDNSIELVAELLHTDPDVSAALNAYLTTADTEMLYKVTDSAGETSIEGQKLLEGILYKIFEISDYSLGFQSKPSLREFLEGLRYMLLMRGAIGCELVFDKTAQPYEIRNVDMNTIKFKETASGTFKPVQTTDNVQDLSLDIPTFFTARYKQNPTSPYNYSFFTSAINTIAARQVVINDLYRIMKVVGYPRITLKVVEEVIRNRAPKNLRDNEKEFTTWMNTQLTNIANKFDGIRPDQPFAHTDSVEPSILNQRQPGSGLQVSEIIETLNAQNQAGLKVVATVLGRGEAGVNTASVESRIFTLSAESVNGPIADIMSRILTLALRMSGFDGRAKVWFRHAELRPDLELESLRIQKQSRLLNDLSLGKISDEYYNIEMYGFLAPEGSEELSGTGFWTAKQEGDQLNDEGSPNGNKANPTNKDNSMGKSVTPDGAENSKSNTIK